MFGLLFILLQGPPGWEDGEPPPDVPVNDHIWILLLILLLSATVKLIQRHKNRS